MLTYPIRTCAGCSGFFLAYDPPYGTHANPAPFLCTKCVRTWKAPAVRDIVKIEGETRRYVVQALDGDDATIRQLGFPEASSLTVRARRLLPDG